MTTKMTDIKTRAVEVDQKAGYVIDEYAGKLTTAVDLNLLSGSDDVFRTAVGGYFFNELDENEKIRVPPGFKKLLPFDNINPSIYSVTSYSGDKINKNVFIQESGINTNIYDVSEETEDSIGTIASENIEREFDKLGKGVSSQNTILPYVNFVCHIEGDPEHSYLKDPATGNKYWETLFTGGSFNGAEYPSIYSNSAFDDHYTFLNLPYTKIEKENLNNGNHIINSIEVGYDYKVYNKNYQDLADNLENEKQGINWYQLGIIANAAASSKNPDEFNSQLTQDTLSYYGLDNLNNVAAIQILNTETKLSEVNSLQNLLLEMNKSPDNVKNKIVDTQSNLIFNQNSVTNFLAPNALSPIITDNIPYYAKINLSTDESGEFVNSMSRNKYSTNFLKTLKEVFLEQTDNKLPLDNIQFLLNQQFLSSSMGAITDVSTATSTVGTFRGIDFTEMLLYSHNNIKNENNDFAIMDTNNIESRAAYDTIGAYRSFNTRNSLNVINETLSGFAGDTSAFYISDIYSLMNMQSKTTNFSVVSGLWID